jgi:hypothetical protein
MRGVGATEAAPDKATGLARVCGRRPDVATVDGRCPEDAARAGATRRPVAAVGTRRDDTAVVARAAGCDVTGLDSAREPVAVVVGRVPDALIRWARRSALAARSILSASTCSASRRRRRRTALIRCRAGFTGSGGALVK